MFADLTTGNDALDVLLLILGVLFVIWVARRV